MRCGGVQTGGIRGRKRRKSRGIGQEHRQVVRCVTAAGRVAAAFLSTIANGKLYANFIQINLACGCLGAVIVGLAACSPRRIPPTSVTDLMENRVMLDGVLMKCNQNPSKARTDSDCMNARTPLIGSPAKESRRKRRSARRNRAEPREAAIGARKAAARTGSEDQGGCVPLAAGAVEPTPPPAPARMTRIRP